MIHVRTIRTAAFMGHSEVDLELPDSGVVVITGPNGAGKSSIVEAVAAALWGKTLRGTPWWGEGGELATVRVETDRVIASRERDGSKINSVRWGLSSSKLRDFETATKAQEELDPLVGPLDTWRRAAVFSSQDLLTFSLATDGERKRLLEGMLGLDVFDRGLVACRSEVSAVKTKAAEIDRKVGRRAARLEVERKRLADAGEALGEEPPAADLAELDRVVRLGKAAREDRRRAAESASATRAFITGLENAKAAAERRLEELAELEDCPTCGQSLDDDARALLGKTARNNLAKTNALPKARETLEAAEAEVEELDDELEVLRSRLEELRRAADLRRSWEERAARQGEKADEIRAVVAELEADLETLGHESKVAAEELATLAVVEKILGLKGVRTHVVARAVSGLENVANAWLDRLLPGVSVAMRAGAGGQGRAKTSSTIQLEVNGLGNGGQYRACSGGERRRVDVAVLLALAEVRAAAAGTVPGTMFFDEVFDTLDADGIAAVAEALREIAGDRCVVVITHAEELADELEAVARIAIADGRIES